jgi:hypothetical protein
MAALGGDRDRDEPLIRRSLNVDEQIWSEFVDEAIEAARFDVGLRLLLMAVTLLLPTMLLSSGLGFWMGDGTYGTFGYRMGNVLGFILAFVVFEPLYLYLQQRHIFRPVDEAMVLLTERWNADDVRWWGQEEELQRHGITVTYVKENVALPPEWSWSCCPRWVVKEQVCLLRFSCRRNFANNEAVGDMSGPSSTNTNTEREIV